MPTAPTTKTPAIVISRGRDRNGLTVARVTTRGGVFTIQTNGNLPGIHSDFTRDALTSDRVAEVLAYVARCGTPRQRRLLMMTD